MMIITHVSGSATCVLRIFRCPNPRYAQVSDADIAILIHYNILGFNVSMNNAVIVHVFKTNNHAC